LHRRAQAEGFRDVFVNPSDIGVDIRRALSSAWCRRRCWFSTSRHCGQPRGQWSRYAESYTPRRIPGSPAAHSWRATRAVCTNSTPRSWAIRN